MAKSQIPNRHFLLGGQIPLLLHITAHQTCEYSCKTFIPKVMFFSYFFVDMWWVKGVDTISKI